MKAGKVVFRRFYPAGYELRHELFGNKEYGGKGNTKMKFCYTPNGDFIGKTKTAHYLCVKKGLTYLQKTGPGSSVCTIGFSAKEQKWYGWSHRAICGFGIGDRVFEERYGNDKTPFTKHGRKKIRTLADAKLAATRMANSVS